MKNRIAVFGSGEITHNSDEYDIAFKIGKSLAKNNFEIINGGYKGTMEAVFKGASIIDNCNRIAVITPDYNPHPNQYCSEIIKTNSYYERLEKLVFLSNGFVVLYGSTGTLLELSAVLALNERKIFNKPVILLDEKWNRVLDLMGYDFSENKSNVYIAKSIEGITDILNEFFSRNESNF